MSERLTGAQYDRVRRAAETHREDLVVRLAGEVGLRPTEMVRLRPGDVDEHGDHYVLRVRESDGVRDAFLPVGVEHDLRKYAAAADAAADEELFDVTSRRLQMLVGDVGERAGVDVSSTALRRYFARSRLADGVPANVVRAVGGWERLSSLESLLGDPDRGDVVRAFTRGRPPTGVGEAVDALAAVADALGTADDRDAVERAVVNALVDAERYRFAAVAGADGTPRGTAGVRDDHAVDLLADLDTDVGEVTVADHAAAPAVVVVPLVHAGRDRGALVVGVGDGVTGPERDLLGVLGSQVGHALAAAERRRLLAADTAVELSFRATGGDSLLAALSATHGCRVSLSGVAPATGAAVCFLAVAGADAADAIEFLDGRERVRDTRLVEDRGDGGFLEVVVEDGPVAAAVEAGGRVTDATAEGGEASLTVAVSDEVGVRDLADGVTGQFPGVSLAAKRDVERVPESETAFRDRLGDRLTERQAAALRAAYYGGYYEWPRGSTAEELADALEVSSPTLHNHLRKANQKLLDAFFDEHGRA